jgi:hypothetical protein
MRSAITEWKKKSEKPLGYNRGKGIWLKMITECNTNLGNQLMKKRIPRPDNSKLKDDLDLL